MRWTKKEREAIEEQIKEYERKIGNTRCYRRCIFCRKYHPYDCAGCPNGKINSILNISGVSSFDCFNNAFYFQEKFSLDRREQFQGFDINMQQLKFRKKMWEDSLSLNKKEFIRKYKGNK